MTNKSEKLTIKEGENAEMKSENGQIVLILILVTTVALAIGISVIQRSLSDISTSSRVEQSSRAFSAAEAGIEKAIQTNPISAIPAFDLGNSSTNQGVEVDLVPDQYQALEYPAIAKEEMAQVWLADPQTLAQYYDQLDVYIYWGLSNITSDKPAIEVTVIYLSGGIYQSKKFFLDSDSSRISLNNFTNASFDCNNPPAINTSLGDSRNFLCRTTLAFDLTGTPTLMLIRARILYSSASQPFAVGPRGVGCGTNACSLPPQAKIFTSTGASGQTQRKVQVFRLDKAVPPYFDFGIFSVGDINK